jgi:hypothetical protein
MTMFLNKVLTELKKNTVLSKKPLIKMLVESTDKSITLGENPHTIYKNLKNGLVSINKEIKSPALNALIGQIKKSETTIESKVEKIGKELNLKAKLGEIKKSHAYYNPMLKHSVDVFESKLNSGVPDFLVCAEYVATFESYAHDKTVASTISQVKKYVAENEAKLHTLYAIYEMDSMNSPVYAGVSNSLKELLLENVVSADILKLKYGNSIPLISNLISNLRLLESKNQKYFTLGEGNGDTVVSNLIAPMYSIKDGMLIYLDNRFLSIRESKKMLGTESKIHINSKYTISEINPASVKEKMSHFYSICEAYANLGFNRTLDGLGVESKSLRNVKLGLKLNETRTLDLQINGTSFNNVDEAKSNLAFATSLQTVQTQTMINTLLENYSKIFNFEFIKALTNDRRAKEAMVAKLDEKYYVCEKLNQVEHEWKELTPNQLFVYVKENFDYDIRPVFGEQISKAEKKINKIEERKREILIEVKKIEESIEKLKVAVDNKDLDFNGVKKLTSIKESLEGMIVALKQEYVSLDLVKQGM